MSTKALITRRAGTSADRTLASVIADMSPSGEMLEIDTPSGAIVRGTDAQFEALQAAGFRVKLLPDTNLLHIGRYTIDVEAGVVPDVPGDLEIAAAEASAWPHHLVQLAGQGTEPVDRGLLLHCSAGVADQHLRACAVVLADQRWLAPRA